jgi:hypothetical protein
VLHENPHAPEHAILAGLKKAIQARSIHPLGQYGVGAGRLDVDSQPTIDAALPDAIDEIADRRAEFGSLVGLYAAHEGADEHQSRGSESRAGLRDPN